MLKTFPKKLFFPEETQHLEMLGTLYIYSHILESIVGFNFVLHYDHYYYTILCSIDDITAYTEKHG